MAEGCFHGAGCGVTGPFVVGGVRYVGQAEGDVRCRVGGLEDCELRCYHAFAYSVGRGCACGYDVEDCVDGVFCCVVAARDGGGGGC